MIIKVSISMLSELSLIAIKLQWNFERGLFIAVE